MRHLIVVICLLLPTIVLPQNAGLESLLEDQLSTEDRMVEIDGFAGALTAQASLDALRVSDAQGVWLELKDVVLDWNRSALFSARLEVVELSASSLAVFRRPESQGAGAPSAEASGFRIPDLPVAILTDRLAVDTVFLGPSILGEPVEGRAELSAKLEDGGLDLRLDAERTDAKPGRALVDLNYAPQAEVLSLDMSVSEPPEGIVARSLSLPGLPSVELTISGGGPLDAFDADIGLATDGVERLTGKATIAAQGGGSRDFELSLNGDIRSLLEPGSRAFFGPEARVVARGTAQVGGEILLDALRVEATQILLEGTGALGSDGTPERFALSGALAREGRAALPGTDVTLSSADLMLDFDAKVSDDWQLQISARDVATEGVTVAELNLDGAGQLVPDVSTPFAGNVVARALGIETPGNAGLSEALGDEIRLSARVAIENGAMNLADIALDAAHLDAVGEATAVPTDGRLAISAALSAAAPNLAPFSKLLGRELVGQMAAELTAKAEIPGGAMELNLNAVAEGVDIGVEPFAPLLTPESALSLSARRDENGTRIEELTFTNPELQASAAGSLSAEDGELSVQAGLRDVGLFNDLVSGPVSVEAVVTDILDRRIAEGLIETEFGFSGNVSGILVGPSASVSLQGALQEVERFVPQLTGVADLTAVVALDTDIPQLDAVVTSAPGVELRVLGPLGGPDQAIDIEANIDDLAVFVALLPGPADLSARVSEIGGDPLINARVTAATGGLNANIVGRPLGDASQLDISADAVTLDFLVPQLAGPATMNGSLADLTGSQDFSFDLASNTGFIARASGQLSESNDAADFALRIVDLGRFVDRLTGGAKLDGTVSSLRQAPALGAQLVTDVGGTAKINALLRGADDIAASASGSVPLASLSRLAGDRALEGRADFDLALSGTPELSNLTGTIKTAGARFFDPTVEVTLSPIVADILLASGRAQVNATASLNGRDIRVTGGAGLGKNIPVDLTVNAVRVPVSYADIFESEVTARLNLNGDATQSVAVSGLIQIEDNEVRIPDTGLGGATPIPLIRHQDAPASVRQTLARAGLSLSGIANSSGGGAAIPLDVTVQALTPIFVRGRGLDAGFDGSVRVTGTASDPVPIGQFSLTRGRLDFLGRRLDLDEGRISVAGSLTPQIDIAGNVVVDDVTARIGLLGPVDEPELVLSSVPELPEDEILARILFGRGIDTLSAFQLARLVSSIRKLSGAQGDGLLEQTRQSLGVDDLDLRTDETTGEAALAIGQTLNEGVYSEVEIGSGGETKLNLNFDLTDSTTVRGSASSNGETGLGIFWQRDY